MSVIHGVAGPMVPKGAGLPGLHIAGAGLPGALLVGAYTAHRAGSSGLLSKYSSLSTPSLNPACAEFVAGAIAEFTKVTCIYPLDLIRNRLSCSSRGLYKNTMDCLLKTVRGEGVLGLYKGIVATYTSNVGKGTLGFGVYGSAVQYFNERSGVPRSANDPLQSVVKASLVSAAASTLFECPLEIMAIQLQTQKARAMESQLRASVENFSCSLHSINASRRAHYQTQHRYGHKGLKDVWATMFRHRAPFLGFGPLLLKNFLWFNGTFCTFHQAKALASRISFGDDSKVSQKKLGLRWKIVCGASSGVVAWTCCFPLEVIKANIMGQPLDKKYRHFRSASQCAQALYAEGGMPRLYRGLTPTVVRAVPAYTIVLNVYDGMREKLGIA